MQVIMKHLPLAIFLAAVLYQFLAMVSLRRYARKEPTNVDPLLRPTQPASLPWNAFTVTVLVMAVIWFAVVQEMPISGGGDLDRILVMSCIVIGSLLVFGSCRNMVKGTIQRRRQENLELTHGSKFVGKLSFHFPDEDLTPFLVTAADGRKKLFFRDRNTSPFKETDLGRTVAVFYLQTVAGLNNPLTDFTRKIMFLPEV